MGDANTDALQRMKAKGDDLTRSRDVDFTVVFPTEAAARQFAEYFRSLGLESSVELSETAEQFPWEVVVVKNMSLSENEIEEFEEKLQDVANRLGGRNDGWGCFSLPSSN